MVSDYLYNGGIYQFDEETAPEGAVPITGAAPVPQADDLEEPETEQETDETEQEAGQEPETEQETDETEQEAGQEPETEQDDDMEPKKRTAPANKSRKAKAK